MMARIPLALIACIFALTTHSPIGMADDFGIAGKKSSRAGRDKHTGFIMGTGRIDPHARYSNDVAYEFGTVSRRGNQQIPYVERCYWTAEPGFFILPTNIRQVCKRYTLENTAE